MMRRFAAAFFLTLLPTFAPAADALGPDQLLEHIRSERAAEVGAMAEREKPSLPSTASRPVCSPPPGPSRKNS